jgi:hypothetical protein
VLLLKPYTQSVPVGLKKAKSTAGTTRAFTVRDDVHVTARDEEVAGASFDEAGGGAQVLDLPRIWGRGNGYGKLARFRWTMAHPLAM